MDCELADLATDSRSRVSPSLVTALAAALAQSPFRNPQSALHFAGDPEFKAVEKEVKIAWLAAKGSTTDHADERGFTLSSSTEERAGVRSRFRVSPGKNSKSAEGKPRMNLTRRSRNQNPDQIGIHRRDAKVPQPNGARTFLSAEGWTASRGWAANGRTGMSALLSAWEILAAHEDLDRLQCRDHRPGTSAGLRVSAVDECATHFPRPENIPRDSSSHG